MDINEQIKYTVRQVLNNMNQVIFNREVMQKLEVLKNGLKKDLDIKTDKKKFYSMKKIDNTVQRARRSLHIKLVK